MTVSAKAGATGRNSTIGTAPSQLANIGAIANQGIQIYASSNNSDTLYIGYGSGITANSADATDGFPLAPGASLFLPIRHIDELYICSTTNPSQVVWYILV